MGVGVLALERVGFSIRRALASLGIDEAAERHRALPLWDEVVGPQLAAHARAVAVRGDVLEVAVPDSIWANQIAFMKADLLQRLNLRLGPARLADLRVRVGALPPRAASRDETLDAGEIRRAEAAAALELGEAVPADERLRHAFLGLVARVNLRSARREGGRPEPR